MPKISKLLTGDEKSLHLFSNDLLWGCRYHAMQASQSQHAYRTFTSNLSCVLFAGSFLEAKLNELSADVVGLEPKEPKAPLAFWKVLHNLRKDLGVKEKWNLIASVSNGKLWDSSCEPFQSYDLIVSLRNELVHYKGEYATVSEPPVNKINALLQRFEGAGFTTLGLPADPGWISRLLSSKELGTWISATVDDLDMKFDHFLTGTKFTDQDRTIYELLNGPHHDPFRNAQS
jgi:hypothetical protein